LGCLIRCAGARDPLANGVPSNFILTYMYVYQMINVSSLYILSYSCQDISKYICCSLILIDILLLENSVKT
jgi:hypothetical protein